MDLQIALLLGQDGIVNGAIYALLALALVLVFAVTRVIFIPQGEFVAYGALTLASFQTGHVPGTLWLLLGFGVAVTALDAPACLRQGKGRFAKLLGGQLVYPIVIVALALGAAPQNWPMALQVLLALAVVVPLGPQLYRLAYQPIAEASVLVLLIVSIAVHLALVGLGLLFFGAEGSRTPPFSEASIELGGLTVTGQSLWVLGASALLIVALYIFFEKSLYGKALRATAVNRAGARLMGISTTLAGKLTFLLAAAIGTLSGILIAPITTVYYDTGFLIGLGRLGPRVALHAGTRAQGDGEAVGGAGIPVPRTLYFSRYHVFFTEDRMDKKEIAKLIEGLKTKKIGMYRKDFLLTWEKSRDELDATFIVADVLRAMREANISPRIWDSGIAVSNFRDNSTRTRFSYASACDLLGLYIQDLDEGKSQIAHGETVRETANMISFLSEAIGIRDDMYLGEGDKYQREVGKALDEGVAAGVLPDRPTVVNLQSDIDHPTQSMADFLHLAHYFGGLDKLKGKKIAMTWAYSPSYGKPLSVPQGIIGLASRLGMEITLAHPEGYDLIPEVVELSKRQAKESGGSFKHVNSMDEAFKDADIVYPKSWAPYDVMLKRVPLLKNGDQAGLKELEKKCLENNARFKDWECTEAKMKLTKGGKALYMHCLPADITDVSCKAGEVAASVFDRYRDDTYREASYKPYIIASMILLGKSKDPAATLGRLLEKGAVRGAL